MFVDGSTTAGWVANARDLTIDEQRQAGKPISGTMGDKYKDFLKLLFSLLDTGAIDPYDTKSFINSDVYNGLDEAWQDKTDLALINIAQQIRMINAFRHDTATPDESPQLETMVEHLWQTKMQIEHAYDVFKF